MADSDGDPGAPGAYDQPMADDLAAAHAAIGRSQAGGGGRLAFWQAIPDDALDLEKQRQLADAWAAKHRDDLAQQWANVHKDTFHTLLADHGLTPDGQPIPPPSSGFNLDAGAPSSSYVTPPPHDQRPADSQVITPPPHATSPLALPSSSEPPLDDQEPQAADLAGQYQQGQQADQPYPQPSAFASLGGDPSTPAQPDPASGPFAPDPIGRLPGGADMALHTAGKALVDQIDRGTQQNSDFLWGTPEEQAIRAQRVAAGLPEYSPEDLKRKIERAAPYAMALSGEPLKNVGGDALGAAASGLERVVGAKLGEAGTAASAAADSALTTIATVAGTLGTPNGRRSAAQLVETGSGFARSLSDGERTDYEAFKKATSPLQPWIDRAQAVRYADMLANVAGRAADVGTGLFHTVEIPTVEALAGLHGDRVLVGAAKERVKGIVGAIPAGFRAAADAFSSGESAFNTSRIEQGSQSARPFGDGPVGRVIGAVPDAMTAADDFFKTINGAGSTYAEAYKIAQRTGRDVIDVLEHPTPELADRTVRAGEYVSYQEGAGAIPKWLAEGARLPGVPGLVVSLAIPFVRVGANIARRGAGYTVRPVVGPLEAAWKAYKGDAEGARMALARTEVAAGLGLLWWSQWSSGNLTGSGPADPNENKAWRAQGNTPNAWNVFGTGVKVPAALMGAPGAHAIILANAFDNATRPLAARAQRQLIAAGGGGPRAFVLDPDTEQALYRWVAGAADGMSQTSYLRQVIDTVKSGGPKDPGWTARTAGSFVGGDVLNRIGAATDPTQRDTRSGEGWGSQFVDTLKSRVPGLRQTLPVKQDVLGRDQRNPAYGQVLPTTDSGPQPSAALQAMMDVGVTPSNPPPTIRVDGVAVPLNRDEQRAYQRYAGEFIDKYVAQQAAKPGWDSRPASQRAAIVKTIQADAAQLAAARVQHDIGGQELKRRIRGAQALSPAPIR